MNVRSEFSYSRARTGANDEVPKKKLSILSESSGIREDHVSEIEVWSNNRGSMTNNFIS